MTVSFQLRYPQIIAVMLVFMSWIGFALTSTLWLDELGSWGLSQGSFTQIFDQSILGQGQGVFYFWILHFWIEIFGDQAWVIRLPSLFFNIATIFVLFRAARSLVGEKFASFVVVIYPSLPMVAELSNLARPYSFANLLAALTWLLLANVNSRSKWVHIAFFILGSSIVFTHYLYLIPSMLAPILAAIYLKNRSMFKGCLAIFCGALFSLLLIVQPFLANISSLTALFLIPHIALFDFLKALGDWPIILCFLLVALGKLLEWTTQGLSFAFNYGAIFLLSVTGIIVGHLTLLILSNAFHVDLFESRYFSIFSIFSAFLCASLLLNIRSSIFQIAACFFFISNLIWHNGYSTRAFSHVLANPWAELVQELQGIPTHCPLYATTGFVEGMKIENFENPSFNSFLKSPLTYFMKKPFSILPLTLETLPSRQYWNEKIEPFITKSSCVAFIFLFPNNAFGKHKELVNAKVFVQRRLPELDFRLMRKEENRAGILLFYGR